MIYVSIQGRLGNQMFSYAFARYIQIQRGEKEKIIFDLSDFEKRGNKLDDSFRNYMHEFKCSENIIESHKKLSYVARICAHIFFRDLRKRKLAYGHDLQDYERKWAKLLNRLGMYIFTFGYYPFKINKNNKDI